MFRSPFEISWARSVSEIAGRQYPFPESQTHSNRRRPPRVLVADDDKPIVDLLRDVLEDAGFAVIRAYDGEQAWDLARQEHPDLVISDVMMPRMGGVGLLRRLRASRELARVPMILMSAVSQPADAERVAFLAKPFDIELVLGLVEAELDAA